MIRKSLLASTFALVSTAAFAWTPQQETLYQQLNQQRQQQAQHQAQQQRQGQAQVQNAQGGKGGSGVASVGAGSGNNSSINLAAPGFAAPLGASGMDCPTVGAGPGGYGPTGGGIFTWTHLSQDCNDRKVATEVIAPTMGMAAANDWMIHQNSEYRDWYNGYVKRASAKPESAAFDCNGPHTNTEWRVHPECAK